ncbi:hypothetical protein CVT24_007229, partial [Panaeolus cyanescens]
QVALHPCCVFLKLYCLLFPLKLHTIVICCSTFNPGTFKGKQKEYLDSCKPEYEVANENEALEDCIAMIVQGYFCRFPPEMPLDYDLTDEKVATAMAREYEESSLPNAKRLSVSEFEVEMGQWKKRANTIKKIKRKITCWLDYQYLKDHNMVKKDLKGAKNPYASLIVQLSGKHTKKPHLRSAMSIWRCSPSIRDLLEKAARACCIALKKPLKPGLAPAREEIASSHFNLLSVEEQEHYTEQAIHPTSHQQCISSLPAVVQPLIDLIADATGWKVTLLAGGPCPTHGGRMSMVNIHSRTTNSKIPMRFGQFESMWYKKYLTPMFTNFLRNSYSVEECRECTLVGDEVLPDLDGATSTLNPQSRSTESETEPSLPLDKNPEAPSTLTPFLNPPPSHPRLLSPDSSIEFPPPFSQSSDSDSQSPPASPPPPATRQQQPPPSPLASPRSLPPAHSHLPPASRPPATQTPPPPTSSVASSHPPQLPLALLCLVKPMPMSAAAAAALLVGNKCPPDELPLETGPQRKSA